MDALANIIARMSPLRDDFSIEIIYNPFISDSVHYVVPLDKQKSWGLKMRSA